MRLSRYYCTRQIGIDAAHRVPTHGSKCRNLHGHRYTIEATCFSSQVAPTGEQTDMTLDFGFLKDIMMDCIDAPADHGLMLWMNDPLLERLEALMRHDFLRDQKLLVLPFIPTAERLAEFWFKCMYQAVQQRSQGIATLSRVRVWETPNCYADYENVDAR